MVEIVNVETKQVEEWKERGNKEFVMKNYRGAMDQYYEGLKKSGEYAPVLIRLLERICIALGKGEEHELSFCYALLLLRMEESNGKGYLEAAKALNAIGYGGLAISYAERAASFGKDISSIDIKKKKNKNKKKKEIKKIEWDSQEAKKVYLSIFGEVAFEQVEKIPGECEFLKGKGDDCFVMGDYEQAVVYYRNALKNAMFPLSTLFCNIAACCMKMEQWEEAVMHSVFSLCVEEGLVKGHYRRAFSFWKMENNECAMVAVENGMELCGQESSLEELHDTIKNEASEGNEIVTSEGKEMKMKNEEEKEEKIISERDVIEIVRKEELAPDSVCFLNQLISMMSVEDRRILGLELMDVPPFHEEFAKERSWPLECNIAECQQFLTNSYESSRSLVSGTLLELQNENPSDVRVLRRLRTNDPEFLDWYLNASLGEIQSRKMSPADHYRILHSFGNVPYREEVMTWGKVHVAIGFVDLGSLLTARFQGENLQPLEWYGYESSAYSVAKTLVLVEMMKMDNVPVNCLLQYWFSAAWSHQTLAFFRSAVARCCSMTNTSQKVQEFLQLWKGASVSLKESRTKWFESRTRSCSKVANLKFKQDRMECISYILTGQLLEADVGSVVMFAIPDGTGSLSFDENFLQCIPFPKLMEHRRKTKSFVQAGISFLRKRLTQLKIYIGTGKIHIHLHHQHVHLGNPSLLKEIQSLSPSTVSWSNICDYLAPKDFFQLARSISCKEDTVHYLYSMNWACDVKGAFIVDVQLESYAEILKVSQEYIVDMYQVLQYSDYFRFPPIIDNAMNIIDYSLFQEYRRLWFSHFFSFSGLANVHNQAICVDMELYNIFSRSNTCFYMTFTFNPSVNFSKVGA